MQEVMRASLIAKAKELLEAGTVTRVLGWKLGEFCYDITPALFGDANELDKEFYFGDFAGANLSKYLVSETRKEDGKVAVFMKPCDTYSFNQLLTEHRIDREKVYVIGIPCDGMLDSKKLTSAADSIKAVQVDTENVSIETLWDGTVTVPRESVLAERCINCKSKKHVAYDELLGDDLQLTRSFCKTASAYPADYHKQDSYSKERDCGLRYDIAEVTEDVCHRAGKPLIEPFYPDVDLRAVYR